MEENRSNDLNNSNDSNDSNGKLFQSHSLYFQDKNASLQLSRIISKDLKGTELKKCLSDLKEKNEYKNAYIKKENIPDIVIQEGFKDENIKPTEKQYELNLDKEKYIKLKTNEVKEEDNLYLTIEDFSNNPTAELFLYDEVVDKIKSHIPMYEDELNKLDINELQNDKIYQGKCVEAMVEQTYNYDKNIKDQMIEEACYLKRIMYCWRRVAGDGNCFYRSVIFSWLEYLFSIKK